MKLDIGEHQMEEMQGERVQEVHALSSAPLS